MQAAAAHLRSILTQPGVVDGKYIVRDPCDVRRVFSYKPFEFIHDTNRAPASVSLTVDLMAAPTALIRTAAGSYEIDRTLSMMCPPCFDITMHINSMSCGPGLAV